MVLKIKCRQFFKNIGYFFVICKRHISKIKQINGNDVRQFCILFAAQFFSYLIVCLSWRALAQARYGWTFGTDVVYGLNNFYLIKRIAQAKNDFAVIGYVLGGAFGSVFAIFVSKHIFGS